MAYAINDFSRTEYQYTGDDGQNYLVSERTAVHAGLSAGALAAKTGAEVGFFPGKPRHAWFKSTTTVGAGAKAYFPRRKIVFNNANYAAITGATLNVDGLVFEPTGRIEGERNHK